MVNASPNARGPNATYIQPARVGLVLGPSGFALGLWGFTLGCEAFHVRISNANLSRFGAIPNTKTQASGFALQWNIGLTASIKSRLISLQRVTVCLDLVATVSILACFPQSRMRNLPKVSRNFGISPNLITISQCNLTGMSRF